MVRHVVVLDLDEGKEYAEFYLNEMGCYFNIHIAILKIISSNIIIAELESKET